MPKLSDRAPKLGQDGQYAVVYSNGKKIRLGKINSPEAKLNYHKFLAEWAAIKSIATVRIGKACLIDELALAYLTWAKENIGRSDFGNYRTAIEGVLEVYSGIFVEEFGPKALVVVQKRFEQRGYARGYCNKLVNFVRTIFRWGVAQELVSSTVADALKYVRPLRQGKTIAPESPPRQDVPDEVVEQTLPHLFPTIAAMIQVQRLAAMRPNEICRMKVGDLELSENIWLYRPGKHKGTWRGHDRVIPLGRTEQEIIGPRLVGKGPEQHVFSPIDTIAEKKLRDAAKRQTKVSPFQAKRKEQRAASPKRHVRDFYDSGTYNQALGRSIEIANRSRSEGEKIPSWTPYQLRHAAVTEITETDGLDVARAVAGQKTISITQRYNHADLKIAVKQAEQRSNRPKKIAGQ